MQTYTIFLFFLFFKLCLFINYYALNKQPAASAPAHRFCTSLQKLMTLQCNAMQTLEDIVTVVLKARMLISLVPSFECHNPFAHSKVFPTTSVSSNSLYVSHGNQNVKLWLCLVKFPWDNPLGGLLLIAFLGFGLVSGLTRPASSWNFFFLFFWILHICWNFFSK